jgi:hypothetical protein
VIVHSLINQSKKQISMNITEYLPFYFNFRFHKFEIWLNGVQISQDTYKMSLWMQPNGASMARFLSVTLNPGDNLIIKMPFDKQIKQIDEYPPDPQRGIDIPQMPIFTSLGTQWSNALVIKPMEPDFSLPFNTAVIYSFPVGFIYLNSAQKLMGLEVRDTY